MKEEIRSIAVENLCPNPDNPRKDMGDLEELANSIKANGVMQNLTVMPMETPGKFMVLMGHRRREAAILAGLKEVPCRVQEPVGRSEQVARMLAENLHRRNLKVQEEALGFELMLKLGETEESIAAKTGFSKTTVHHRVNIAKLDQKKLKERQEDESFQLSITDLIALEQVKDIKTRNKILAEARDSKDLAYKAKVAADEAKREANLAKLIPMLQAAGIKAAPDGVSSEIYGSKWAVVETISLSDEVPEAYHPKEASEQYYYKSYREIKIIKPAQKKKKEKEQLTEAEKRAKEAERQKKQNRKQLVEIAREADALRRDFIMGIISGKIAGIKGEELAKAQSALWQVIFSCGIGVSRNTCIAFYCDKTNYYDASAKEREAAEKWVNKLDMTAQMLVVASRMCKVEEIIGADGEYRMSSEAERVKNLYAALALFGLRPEKDLKEILSGKHPLFYVKPAPKSAKQPVKKKAAPVKKVAAKQEVKKAEAKTEDKAADAPGVEKPAEVAQTKSVETAAGSAGEKAA